MILVHNCKDNVIVVAFISELQVTHSYKALVKHEVTKMRDISLAPRSIFEWRMIPDVVQTAPPSEGAKWRK